MYFACCKFECHCFKCPLWSGFYWCPRLYKVTRDYGYDIHWSWLGVVLLAVKLKEHIDFAIKRFEFVRKELDPWVGVQTCFALLLIVRHTYVNKEEMRVMDIGTLMATSSASASRNIHWLVKHKLIELYENPDRRIEKFVKLTKKGREFVKDWRDYEY